MNKVLLILLISSFLYFVFRFIRLNSENETVRKIFDKMNLKHFEYREFDSRAVQGIDPKEQIYTNNGKQYLKDSGLKNMNNVFLLKLDKARRYIENGYNRLKPNKRIVFRINSGYRTKQYNEHLQSLGYDAVTNSAHRVGRAADISVLGYSEEQIKEILRALRKEGFNRFGLGNNYIHVDDDPTKQQNVFWRYSSNSINIDPFKLEL